VQSEVSLPDFVIQEHIGRNWKLETLNDHHNQTVELKSNYQQQKGNF
jgi:hypothetical protein